MRTDLPWTRGVAVAGVMAVALGVAACSSDDPEDGGSSGGTVTVIGTWGGDEEEAFREMVAPFEEESGITVEYTGTRDLNAVLTTGVASGVLPDLAGLPGPGQMRQFAERGALVPLSDIIDIDTYQEETSPGLVELGTVEDEVVGVFIKAAVKGLIWYNPNTYSGGAPATWEDLEAAADETATGDMKPWCVGLESGAASGWPGTDWIENFVLRQSGPDVYDAWTEGEHAWSSPEIRAAFEAYGEVVSEERTYGGSDYVINTNFGSAANPMFADDPGCVFHQQASFITEFFQNEGGASDGDYDFFRMPDINPEYAGAMTGAGDLFGMFNDTSEARALMKYLVTADAQSIWVGIGGAISGNTTVSNYPDDISARSAEMLGETEVFRFDASDLMPEAMNNAFWSAMLDYTKDPGRLDDILAELDEAQSSAYTEE
jgi:alpha-glucoside transport system substrate-binding protein